MSEQQKRLPEAKYSPEQMRLITTARIILDSPFAETTERTTSRPTTTREKAILLLGRVVGKNTEPLFSTGLGPDRFFDAPASTIVERKTRIVPDYWAEAGWFVQELTTTDCATGQQSEALDMYRVTMELTGRSSNLGADGLPRIVEEHPLLSPIDEQSEVARLQSILDENISQGQ